MKSNLDLLAKKIRFDILSMTTRAGSGHATSSLSATDLITTLAFGGFFRYDIKRPVYHNNDRLIFSKGHASPLFYSLFSAAGGFKESELKKYRSLRSRLEGHPMMSFPFTESPTGSLGQGLSIGVGTALAAKMDRLSYTTYVLCGDSEMSEGQVWEAIQIASYYKLDNLVALIDINRLGQTGQTMYGHNLKAYEKRFRAFGWKTVSIDGHSYDAITTAFQNAKRNKGAPFAILAKTIKGKGVSFLENKNGWHGKALNAEQLSLALKELQAPKQRFQDSFSRPKKIKLKKIAKKTAKQITYNPTQDVSTRRAYGNALVRIAQAFPSLIVLDAEVSNSTYAEMFKEKFPKRYVEMFIAEQNMASAAIGFARRGKVPFISSFSAFLTRAFDQFRIAQYANVHMVVCGSHAGVSIGQDGASQMGLQDIAMFRTLMNTTVLYPSDAMSTEKLVEQAAKAKGIVYLRTTRAETPLLYKPHESFPIGKSKILRRNKKDVATIIAAGITVHEALKSYDELAKQHIFVRVIDCYSVKPIDEKTIREAARDTKAIVVVEDHVAEGGIADAVRSVFTKTNTPIISLAVRSVPKSGKPEELLEYEKISASAISATIKRVIR